MLSLPNRRLLLLPNLPLFFGRWEVIVASLLCPCKSVPQSSDFDWSAFFIRRRVERFCLNGFYFPFDSEVYDLTPLFFPIDRVFRPR